MKTSENLFKYTAAEKRAIDSAFSALSYATQRSTSAGYRLEKARKELYTEGKRHYSEGSRCGNEIAPGYVATQTKALLLQWARETEAARQKADAWDYLTSIRPEAYAVACVMSELRRLLSPAEFSALLAQMETGTQAKSAEESRRYSK